MNRARKKTPADLSQLRQGAVRDAQAHLGSCHLLGVFLQVEHGPFGYATLVEKGAVMLMLFLFFYVASGSGMALKRGSVQKPQMRPRTVFNLLCCVRGVVGFLAAASGRPTTQTSTRRSSTRLAILGVDPVVYHTAITGEPKQPLMKTAFSHATITQDRAPSRWKTVVGRAAVCKWS